MTKLGYLLIDGSNIAHANNAGAILTAGTQETQAIYGTLRSVRKAAHIFPQLKPIVLWDGNVNWRKHFYPEYKANRDKEPETKHEIESAKRRASLKQQLPLLKVILRKAGIQQIYARNLEADDLAGLLSRRYADAGKKVMLVSSDKDWLQLIRPGVGQIDPIHDRRWTLGTFSERVGYEKVKKDKATGDETREWRGVPSPQAHLECKALMGDVGDNVPGVGGIGEIGAIELVIRFGTVQRFFNAVEIDKVKVPKKLADFCSEPEKRNAFYRNLHLMDLAHKDIPKPENTIVFTDPTDPAAFRHLCGEYAFKTILADLDGWLAPFTNQH